LVWADRPVTIQHIVNTMGISYGSMQADLTDILGMSKLSARWVPRMLSPDQKLTRAETSRALWARVKADRANFFRIFVTRMKHAFITLNQNQRIKASNESTSILHLLKRSRWWHLLERSWCLFSGTVRESS